MRLTDWDKDLTIWGQARDCCKMQSDRLPIGGCNARHLGRGTQLGKGDGTLLTDGKGDCWFRIKNPSEQVLLGRLVWGSTESLVTNMRRKARACHFVTKACRFATSSATCPAGASISLARCCPGWAPWRHRTRSQPSLRPPNNSTSRPRAGTRTVFTTRRVCG